MKTGDKPAWKSEWDTRSDLGEFAVYPGHPVTLAYMITDVFATYEEAFAKSETGAPNALCANAISGAGGCVYMALDLLQRLKNGASPEEAFAWADTSWGNTDDMKRRDMEKYRQGQEQADRFKDKLLGRRDWWS